MQSNKPICRGNQYQKAWKLQNGMHHREDGPAIIWGDGSQAWYLRDKKHRLDGPAFVGVSGNQAWWANDKRHRIDGPAVIAADGSHEWWVNGKEITDEYDLSLFDSEEGRMILAIKYGRVD